MAGRSSEGRHTTISFLPLKGFSKAHSQEERERIAMETSQQRDGQSVATAPPLTEYGENVSLLGENVLSAFERVFPALSE